MDNRQRSDVLEKVTRLAFNYLDYNSGIQRNEMRSENCVGIHPYNRGTV